MRYSDSPTIGLVISTYASLPYVHLGLECWRRNYSHIPVLVHDDCSNRQGELKTLCDQYGAAFSANDRRHGHTVGDLSAFAAGLQAMNTEIVVKFSRRFIPLYDWTPELIRLAKHSQAATFSNICRNLNWGFRTECVGMHRASWLPMVPRISAELEKPKTFVEKFLHDLAKELDKGPHNWCSGYCRWGILGENRVKKVPQLLWHHSSSTTEYLEQSQRWELPYTLEMFRLPESYKNAEHRY